MSLRTPPPGISTARPSATSRRRCAPKAPAPKPRAAARTNSAAQSREIWSRGKLPTTRFVMLRSTISQRASTSTKRPMRYTAHSTSTEKTTVRIVSSRLPKRFALTHSDGDSFLIGGRSLTGVPSASAAG